MWNRKYEMHSLREKAAQIQTSKKDQTELSNKSLFETGQNPYSISSMLIFGTIGNFTLDNEDDWSISKEKLQFMTRAINAYVET